MLSHKLFFCVSVELFSRAVASQVFSPLQRLTSVFGMGTGGPTALKTLTQVLPFGICTNFIIGSELWSFLRATPSLKADFVRWCTSGDSNPGPTD